jgi:hypothetical protein
VWSAHYCWGWEDHYSPHSLCTVSAMSMRGTLRGTPNVVVLLAAAARGYTEINSLVLWSNSCIFHSVCACALG